MQTVTWILKRINYPGEVVFSGQGEYCLGRGRGNYEEVLSLYVSRKHCIFRVTDNGVAVEDLCSLNGTFVNEERIPAKTYYPLRESDNIGIGVKRVQTVEESGEFVYRLVKEEFNGDIYIDVSDGEEEYVNAAK